MQGVTFMLKKQLRQLKRQSVRERELLQMQTETMMLKLIEDLGEELGTPRFTRFPPKSTFIRRMPTNITVYHRAHHDHHHPPAPPPRFVITLIIINNELNIDSYNIYVITETSQFSDTEEDIKEERP